MAAHASQINETSIFLGLADDLFDLTWGIEWFTRRAAPQTERPDPISGIADELAVAYAGQTT
jgi:hypothetical protein